MIRIINIVRQILNDIKEALDEFIIHENCTTLQSTNNPVHNNTTQEEEKRTQILNLDPLNPRHLIHQIHQQSMQPRRDLLFLLPIPRLQQLQQPGEQALLIHHPKRHVMLSTVKEQERYDEVKSRRVVILHHQTSISEPDPHHPQGRN